jgi:hypothetical protein
MARSRNIKPAFFLNDDLAEKNCALGRLLFIGLWTLADYRGNLEWRSGKVKAQILPYDECDINKIAINLDKSGFIRFYSDGDRIFANIVNFVKHQNPHKNEKQAGSDIPEFNESMRQVVDLKELTINRDLSRLKPEQDGTNPADSLLLIPDSLLLIPSCGETEVSPNLNKFLPPSKQEVWAYMFEIGKGSELEAEKFVDFYQSKGWVVGKTKMKDWKASVRNWTKSQQPMKPMKQVGTVEQISQAAMEFINERT